MSATAVYTQTPALQVASGNSGDLSVGDYAELAIDINITGNQGSGPTIQFILERKGADGVYYPIWQSTVIAASSAQISTSVGAGLAYSQSFGQTARLRWALGGTSTPGFTYSVSIYGK